jgi:flagellar biosynthesis regulator FlbT
MSKKKGTHITVQCSSRHPQKLYQVTKIMYIEEVDRKIARQMYGKQTPELLENG